MGAQLSESREALLRLIGSTLRLVSYLLGKAERGPAHRNGVARRCRLETRVARLQALVALIEALGSGAQRPSRPISSNRLNEENHHG